VPGGQPVKNRLDLVGGSVAGSYVSIYRRSQGGRRRVALVASPGLNIAGWRRLDPAGVERNCERIAQHLAVALIVIRFWPQSVVEVEGFYHLRSGDPNGEVQEAGRVPPA